MNTISFSGAVLTVCTACTGCAGTKIHSASAEMSLVQTEGRVGIYQNIAEIYWPGSGATATFKGSLIKAVLQDERGHNYFNVVIDDSLVNVIRIDTAKSTYLLASGLLPGKHTVKLLKRADWFRGKTTFFAFETDGKFKENDHTPRRAIEFYGNSVTVGAAVEDYRHDSGDSTYTNNFRSYAAITARHFNAAYSCIASSGIGLMVSWGSLIMPEIYNRLNPADSTSQWNFAAFQPGIVVINLLQNDQALVNLPDHPQFKRRFGNHPPDKSAIILSYKNFVLRLRQHYPDADIICTLGSMDVVQKGSEWPGYMRTAVEELKDPKIFTYCFAYKNTPGHPKTAEQRQMAEELIAFIKTHIGWQ